MDEIMVSKIFKEFIEDGYIILTKKMSVNIDSFCELFKEVNDDISYDKLMIVDGGKKGYKDFFNRCKERGILN